MKNIRRGRVLHGGYSTVVESRRGQVSALEVRRCVRCLDRMHDVTTLC
jgi:hypothetical protein